MQRIADLKVDQLKVLLRARDLPSSGARSDLILRLMEFEKSESVDMAQTSVGESAEKTAISQLQEEMMQLKEMMTQFVNQQVQRTNNAENVQPVHVNPIHAPSERSQSNDYNAQTRQASVKEIANTLPEFDPSNVNAISVEQFIERVDKVMNAYQWEDKFLMLAICSQLKGSAKMWYDSSPILHTTWREFANALREEFGSTPDEAEIHYAMANAIRRPKEAVKEYCFRMSALGVRYNISEAAVIRYTRAGLQHRELQQSIAAIQFATMKQMRDTADAYFVNKGRLQNSRPDPIRCNDKEPKQEDGTGSKKPREILKCYNCGEVGHFANACPKPQKNPRCGKCHKFHATNKSCTVADVEVKRLGAKDRDKWFTKKIVVQSQQYIAFLDTGSQASLVRKSVAQGIAAEHRKCPIRMKGICGGTSMLDEGIIVDIAIDDRITTALVYIVEDEFLREDFLLGQDVIVSMQLTLQGEIESLNCENKRAGKVSMLTDHQRQKFLENAEQEDDKAKLHNLLESYADVFSSGLNGIGKTNIVEAAINIEDGKVISQAPYRIPEPKRAIVNNMIEELLQHDIISPSSSEYASPIVLIKKQNGGDRLCVDYRRLNQHMKKENFPVPNIEERLQEAKKFKYFSSLDLNSGYYQIEMASESRKYTAFITTDGLYEFKRMPFGLKNAPATFNRLMAEIQKRVQKGDMIHYMDDILVGSHGFDEMCEKLGRILKVLRECGLTLNSEKCEFYKQTITFLGHQIHSEGISPGEVKTQAISKFPAPTNVREVRQFLGLSGYFRKFVAGYAIISEPLRMLLRKNKTFVWEQPQQEAFDILKQKLIDKPVVASYRLDAIHEVHTDASSIGLAGVLLQMEEQQLQPIAYFSRATSSTEKNFHSYELEALAVVESLERFKYYICGKPVTVVTDCNALKTTMEKRELIPRIARWWLRIQDFDVKIVHRSGTRMEHVDALSRAPQEKARELDTANMKMGKMIIDESDWLFAIQLQDKKIQSIVDSMRNHEKTENDEYVIEQGRLYRKHQNQLLWVVPKQLRYHILQESHDNAGHMGIDKTISRIHNLFWFPRMRNYVKSYIKCCVGCALNKQPSGRQEGQYHYDDMKPIPFSTIHVDHLGPFPKSSKRNEHIFVIVDAFTKFTIIRAVKSTASKHVCEILREVTSYLGMPTRIISDRGTAFTSKEYEKFCRENNVKRILNAVRTPRANGHVERMNRVIMSMLLPMTDNEKRWDEKLRNIQWSINTMVNKTTKCSPFQLLYGYEPRDVLQNTLVNVIQSNETEMMTDAELQQLREEAAARVNDHRAEAKQRYDAKHSKPTVYETGDLILVENEPFSTGNSRKLEPRYKGPFIVSKVLPHDRYLVEDIPNAQRTQRHYKSVYASDKMKPWCKIPPDDDDDEIDEDENNESREDASMCQEAEL